jgi:hypothetical protein
MKASREQDSTNQDTKHEVSSPDFQTVWVSQWTHFLEIMGNLEYYNIYYAVIAKTGL